MSQQFTLDWFEVREFEHEIVGIGEPGHFEDVKSFLIRGSEQSLLIDSGMGLADLRTVVEAHTDRPVLLVNSHAHLDHIGDNWRFDRRWAHPLEVERLRAGVANQRVRSFLAPEAFTMTPPADLDVSTFQIPGTEVERTVDDGDVIDLGNRAFTVIHTPGHTAGSISFFEQETGVFFAGDAVYEGPLFALHEDASARSYRSTLRRLRELVPDTSVVYPSHNRYPLDPSFIVEVANAIEHVWNGRRPDLESNGQVHWDFGQFSISFKADWQDED